MKMKVLSGIAQPVLDELLQDGTRTIELRSANNIMTILDQKPGDHIFLSNKKRDDINKGTNGIIAKIQNKKISMHHISYTTDSIYEEKELTIVRIKTQTAGLGTINKIIKQTPHGITTEITERTERYSAG
ncbi:DUF473 domain-containing protein [Methanonatronarchaeum sp. AMET-Sl]|uniref:DUF473 domain-containing protein n=1 Tax=Methanonatronarchaeum sp. AMET-Sl TaxID=3037654 RepID=UPI00244DC452|nr:DUF473 domain-containing protein [Methanonatronarchaeum sp. AMET-Sl]WGI18005.1 DUF473 domain-containing protein [Methanonatronarchaeum sp. AMET-Sl]